MNKKRFISYLFLLCFPITLLGQKGLNDTTYILTYDHGGLILWGGEHFIERLKNATEWLDKYPSFKIGLDNEAQIYDHFAEDEPHLLKEMKDILSAYDGRIGIGSCTYGQPLSQFISDESNIRQIAYALDTERKIFNYRPPVYLMSEHAMHSQIPQIINGFGFDGAIMRTHFMMYGYINKLNGEHHVALVKGEIGDGKAVLCRVHSECLTGDAFGSQKCDCGEQLQTALRMIEKEGRGVLLYLRQEGRGIGLINKIKAYALQDQGYDTIQANIMLGFPADMRDYTIGSQILEDLGVHELRLMTNNPEKIDGIAAFDLKTIERVPIQMELGKNDAFYLLTKKEKMGHLLTYPVTLEEEEQAKKDNKDNK